MMAEARALIHNLSERTSARVGLVLAWVLVTLSIVWFFVFGNQSGFSVISTLFWRGLAAASLVTAIAIARRFRWRGFITVPTGLLVAIYSLVFVIGTPYLTAPFWWLAVAVMLTGVWTVVIEFSGERTSRAAA